MSNQKASYALILIPLLLLCAGQVLSKFGSSYSSFFNIFVLLGYLALIARGLVWVFVLNKLPVSFAYPFMSLSFILILLASSYFFHETVSANKILGSFLIIAGVIFTTLGHGAGATK